MDAGAHQSRREARSALAWRTDLCDRALIEAKADLEATQNQGFTALMLSAQNGNDRVAQVLLKAGADRTKEVPGYCWLRELGTQTVICILLKE